MIRNAHVAGQFYPANKTLLESAVSSCVDNSAEKIDAKGCVAPHAGYMFSGEVAGSVLSRIEPKETYVILGPNHTGRGKPFGLDLNQKWRTPLGTVEPDKELGSAIVEMSALVRPDEACHEYEHSIEVQLPFLQVLSPGFKMVPIVVSSAGIDEYTAIGESIAAAVKKTGRRVTVISSSDMTHFEPHQQAKEKDGRVIEKMLEMDVEGFLSAVAKDKVTMCGDAPTAVMLTACRKMGAKHSVFVKYQTSGEKTGDMSSVVGYAGIIIY